MSELRRKVEEAIYNVSPEFDDNDNRLTYQESLDGFLKWLEGNGKEIDRASAWERQFQREAEAAMAVIAQDRAARLKARMPEIEHAIAEVVCSAVALTTLELTTGEPMPDPTDARRQLLALIREMAG